MRIVIIEDEPIAARDLERNVRKARPGVEITAVLHSVRTAREWLSQGKEFDLLITDVELGDGNCFEVFSEYSVTVPVIFTTAYDHFALEAFQHNGISYLLKPFGLEAVQDALEKAARMQAGTQVDLAGMKRIMQDVQPRPQRKTLLIRAGDRLIPLATEKIALLSLVQGKVWIHTLDGAELPMDQTLEDFEKDMPVRDFFRLNRQTIVSRKAIRDAVQRLDRKMAVNLVIPVKDMPLISREKVPIFLEWLSEES